MSFLEPQSDEGLNMFKSMSFRVHDERHKKMVGRNPTTPQAPNVNDTANRMDDAERRRLLAGGRNATRTSSTAAPAGGARPTLTGLGG